MSGVQYYASGKAKKLRTLPELIKAETVKGIRRGQQRIKRASAEGLSQRSIGRALFGRKLSGAYKQILREKVTESGGVFSAPMRYVGIPSIQEQGGPIRPHRMTVRGKAFMHPGVKAMPRFPFVEAAVNSKRGEFKVEIAKGMAKVAEIVNRG